MPRPRRTNADPAKSTLQMRKPWMLTHVDCQLSHGKNGGCLAAFSSTALAASSTEGGSASTSCGAIGLSSAISQASVRSASHSCGAQFGVFAASFARASSMSLRRRCGSARESATSIWLWGDQAVISRFCRSRASGLLQGRIVENTPRQRCGNWPFSLAKDILRITYCSIRADVDR